MNNEVPVCPGCHFTCAIDGYQSARGEAFHERWAAGEELPVRRGPGRPPEGGMPEGTMKPTSDERIMHLLHILEIALSEILRNDNTRTDRQTDKEVDNQVDERSSRSDRRLRNRSVFCKFTYNNIIRRIVQKLQKA